MRCRVAEESAASGWGQSGRGFSFSLHVWVNTHGSQRQWRWIVCDGKSPRLKRNPNFLCPLSMSFCYDENTTCKSPCSNFALLRVHLSYLGDYVHFLGINAHNSSSNNRCMKGSTRTAWKTMLVPFSKFLCLLQGMGRYFSRKCVAIVNHKCLFVGFSTIEKMK